VLIMHKGEGKCSSEQNYLREAVEQKGRDISPFNEVSPALVDCFFLCHIFSKLCSFMQIIQVYVT
jgi:hypothetical protein